MQNAKVKIMEALFIKQNTFILNFDFLIFNLSEQGERLI